MTNINKEKTFLREDNIDNIVGLTPLQEGLLYHYITDESQSLYCQYFTVKFKGDFDEDNLISALYSIQVKNEVLRSIFKWDKLNEPVQIIFKSKPLLINIHNIVNENDECKERKIKEIKDKIYNETIDIKENPLFFNVIQISRNEFELILSYHHILLDGWSLGIILREFIDTYNSDNCSFKAKSSYVDFIKWSKKRDGIASRDFWKNYLYNFDQVTDIMPCNNDKIQSSSKDFKKVSFSLDVDQSNSIYTLIKKLNVTLSSFFYAIYSLILKKYNDTEDVVFGTTVSGRSVPVKDIEKVVGMLINTIPLRDKTKDFETISKLIRNFNDNIINVNEYENTSLSEIKSLSSIDNKKSLFESLVVVENYPLEDIITYKEDENLLEIQDVDIKETNNYSFTLYVVPRKSTIELIIQYDTVVYSEETINRFLDHFLNSIIKVFENPNTKIGQLDIVTEREKNQLIRRFNDTVYEDKILHSSIKEIFEEKVDKIPNSTAIIFNDEKYTYNDIEIEANKVANFLLDINIKNNDVVGLYLNKSPKLIIGLLGILKSGAAFLPLDPKLPSRRLKYMCINGEVNVILHDEEQPLFHNNMKSYILGDLNKISITDNIKRNEVKIDSDDLSYVMYTSGTTGTPKGVMVTNQALINRLNWFHRQYTIKSDDVILNKTTFTFDVSLWELLLWFMGEATVCILNDGKEKSPQEIVNEIQKYGVTVIHFVPAMLNSFFEYIDHSKETKKLRTLKRICASGEELKKHHKKRFKELIGDKYNTELINLYGPTEATIDVTHFNCSNAENDSVYIGRPIDNTQIYILDRNQQIQPVNIYGEIYISGLPLSKGYINNTKLTIDSFLDHPFIKNSKIYRSGDRGRILPDGNIEYKGRIDNQLKVRGFRIEMSEIEQALFENEKIKEAVVLNKTDLENNKYIAAYLVFDQDISLQELKNTLESKLPDYMIPSEFYQVLEIPLKSNGKIDEENLKSNSKEKMKLEKCSSTRFEYETIEGKVKLVWCELLQTSDINLYDNFFDVGGNSLLLTKYQLKIEKHLKLKLSILDLLKYPTISSIAEFIKNELGNKSLKESESPHLTEYKYEATNDIAIIGIGARLPDNLDLEEFWKSLIKGKESVTFFDNTNIKEKENYVKAHAKLKDIDLFDANFFGLNPREAELLDPQQRLLLECSFEALEDAGYRTLINNNIGIFGGVSYNTYFINNILKSNRNFDKYSVYLSNGNDFSSTRAAYLLNLNGPSVNIQTACSTSLVSLHVACQNILDNKCRIALAGGATVQVPQNAGYEYKKNGIKSKDGHCKAFDANSTGFVGGNGAGIVVLKRLEEAIKDKDQVYAVIKGSAINNDGNSKVSYTAPSVKGQSEVIRKALINADINPETISYVEAHGTGTQLGDPIEVAALTKAFRAGTDKNQYCALGSVKSNIGHLDAAAGVAGLIKTALALKHKVIPPTVHFKEPNPNIDFENSPFYVNTELEKWKTDPGVPRRAGVSSFGMGGTNAHVVLEEAPEKYEETSPPKTSWQLIQWSTKTETALEMATENLEEYLKSNRNQSLADIAFTLQVGRENFKYRRYAVVSNIEDAVKAIENRKFISSHNEGVLPVTFMFPGQGTQYINMSKEIYETEDEFKEQLDYCAEQLKTLIDVDIREIIFPSSDQDDKAKDLLSQTYVTQPALFAIEYSLAKMLMNIGVNPGSMIGHSIGEYAAACISGVLSLDDALRIVSNRGRLIQSLPKGKMLAVMLDEKKLRSVIEDQLSIAVINNDNQCVVSGELQQIDRLEEKLRGMEIVTQRLETSHAFHSYMMEPILEDFRQVLKTVQFHTPSIPFISNLTGTWITDSEAMSADYWVQHLRETVRFAGGIGTILESSPCIMMEVGPGHTLSNFVNLHPSFEKQKTITCLRHSKDPKSDNQTLLQALGELWLSGHDINWDIYHKNEGCRRISLPTYPFERKRYWVEPSSTQIHYSSKMDQGLINTNNEELYIKTWKRISLKNNPIKISDKKCWIVLMDDYGVGNSICSRLEQNNQKVIKVFLNEKDNFCDNTNLSWYIDPSINQFKGMLSKLLESNIKPDILINAHNLRIIDDNHRLGNSELLMESKKSYYLMLYMVQAYENIFKNRPLKIINLTNDLYNIIGIEKINPIASTSIGLCKIIPQEIPSISCKNIDMSNDFLLNKEKIYKVLLNEIFTSSKNINVVAHRGNYLWEPSFEVYDSSIGSNGIELYEQNTYLVIGGLGKIGLTNVHFISQYMEEGKIIIIGRSKFPSQDNWDYYLSLNLNDEITKKIHLLKDVIHKRIEIVYIQSDLSDKSSISSKLSNYSQDIKGVFFAAGLSDINNYSSVLSLDNTKSEAQFKSKLDGIVTINNILNYNQLDFYIINSSISTTLGGLGFGAYNAANFFLDTYSSILRSKGFQNVITINWDSWKLDNQKDEKLLELINNSNGQELNDSKFDHNKGLEILKKVVSNFDDFIVATTSLEERITKSIRTDNNNFIEHSHKKSNGLLSEKQLIKELTNIWSEYLGLSNIRPDDNFFDVGGNSLYAVNVNNQITKEFGIELSLIDIYEFPTINSLVKKILSRNEYVEQNNSSNRIDRGMKRRLIKRRQQRRRE
ncbi:amino acid adenylation domain-containing protein [Virgibacillus sp. NKC19-3]|uniref:non-ribosomal peptide synthetase/type I polyketide synthase n=1 Tax=Virgibacillus saliphilus TaxID=2831674 RepID=UPI001C9A34FB|nr:non-ribosomal peptide synthetase/type I polyketide synthase [Virgibacillus sp. NKC19-3]MBY7142453.1 amino acid adenylation domain-containing protein [Virgibacillus sp. NKC19-3]